MRMRFLITGSNGFIARNIVERLRDRHDIEIFHRNMSVYDIKVKPDCIIHCAAELYDESEMFKSNVLLTHNLLQYALLKSDCRKFIYMGTSSEYGRMNQKTKETDRINPTTLYESTKGCGTLLVQSFSRQYGLPGIVIRPYTIYGPHENEKKLVPTIYRAHKDKIPLSFVKEPYHDWTYIEDFVSGVEKLLEIDYVPGDIVNFGTGCQTSNIEILNIIETILGEKIPYTEVSSLRSYDSNFWACDNSYARQRYGIVFPTGVTQGMEKYLSWMQSYYS